MHPARVGGGVYQTARPARSGVVCSAPIVTMLARTLYSNALRVAMPAVLARLLWRSRRTPAYRRRWGERFGAGPGLVGRPLWVHAVSVGETLAAVPVVEALLARYPGLPVLVTTTTPTGSERARAAFGDRVSHCYAPYDTPGAVRRFYGRVRPRLGLIMETELWPNLLAEGARRGVPLVLANARLSEHSARGYRRVAGLAREALGCLTLIAAQAEADAARFLALGVDPARVRVTGSVKFDQAVAEPARAEGRRLRAGLGPRRPIWIAASTHDGEEAAVLAAHAEVRRRHPDAALILVPRHPGRFGAVAGLCLREGFATARRTAGEPAPDCAVYIGDTMGELPAMLAAADVAFIGGSLVAVGGHNLLEPASLGLPVVVGPHVFNFARIHALLAQAGAVVDVRDAAELAAAVGDLLADPAARGRLGEAASGVVAANRGARERLIELVAPLLSDDDRRSG